MLARERYGPHSGNCAGEFGEDREVGVQPNSLDASDSQREECPFVLEPSELALDRATATVELA